MAVRSWAEPIRPAHNFSANFIYNIPILRNSSNGLVKSLVGGWAVSGIITIESGLPINVSGGSSNIVGGATPGNRPDLNGKITYSISRWRPRTPSSTSSTTIPRSLQLLHPAPGATSATTLCAGRAATTGTSLSSRPSPSGRAAGLQLRLETFNTFNHTQFQTVDNGLGDSRFGQFTSAYPARIVQLAGKVYF